MNNDELHTLIRTLKELTKKVKLDPELAKKFLFNAGIYTEDGKLTENYKEDGE